MSCTQAKVSLVFSDIKASVSACRQAIVSVSPETSDAIADAEIEKAIKCAEVKFVESGLIGKVSDVDSGVRAVVKVICVPGPTQEEIQYYLEIDPEIIWVYPDFEVDNMVYSNTDWTIN